MGRAGCSSVPPNPHLSRLKASGTQLQRKMLYMLVKLSTRQFGPAFGHK